MGYLQQFRHYFFTSRALELAIGVVVGVSFGDVIKSLVANVISPLMSLIGDFDFSKLSVDVRGASFMYGQFINDTIAFLLVAVTVYAFVVRPKQAYERKLDSEADPTITCLACLSTIPAAARRCAFCREDTSAVVAA